MASSFFRICSEKLRVVTEKYLRNNWSGRHPAARLRDGEQWSDGREMLILLTQWMRQKHKETILHYVYAYKDLNSPTVQECLQSTTASGPDWPLSGPPHSSDHGCCIYLILTFWTDPHAFRNGFQGWIQAVQMINTRTSVAHEQLATASAHSAEILMDVSLWGRIGPISFPAQLNPTTRLWRGGRGSVIWLLLAF